MKKNNFIKYVFLCIFIFGIFFVSKNNISATDRWKRVTSWPANIVLDEKDEMYHFTKKNFNFYYKRDTRGNKELQVLCVSGNNIAVRSGYQCTTGSQFSDDIRIAIGSMMKNYTSLTSGWKDRNDSDNENITLIDKYWYLQIAVDTFLKNHGVNMSFNGTLPSGGNIDKIYTLMGNTVYSIYKNISEKKVTIGNFGKLYSDGNNYSANATYSVKFSNSDNQTAADKYIDNEDSCTTNNSLVKCSVNKGNLKISFAKTDLKTIASSSIKVTVNRKYTFDKSINYNCGSGYQVITPLITQSVFRTVSGTQTLTIPKLVKIRIGKVDENNKVLAGSILKITGPNGYSTEVKPTTGPIELPNITTAGTYTITEVVAPDGYTITTPRTFKITTDSIASGADLGVVYVKDNPTQVLFQKIDAISKKNVSGATLQILDKDKKPILDSNGKEMYKWVTIDKPYVVYGLKVGTYYLQEVKSPNNYRLNNNMIKFEVKNDGSINTITMEDYPKINVNISKQDVTNGKELPGATLVLLDKDKKPILNEKGKNKYEWISTDQPHLIDDLEPGEYCLKETISPKGYTKTEELVCFKIDYSNLDNKVVMKNSPIVKVPNTAKTASLPIIIISSILLISGVSIVGYIIYKNKKTS